MIWRKGLKKDINMLLNPAVCTLMFEFHPNSCLGSGLFECMLIPGWRTGERWRRLSNCIRSGCHARGQ